jgi:ATP-dependent 26S proteasome regulatory subunit
LKAQDVESDAINERTTGYLNIDEPYNNQWELIRDFMSMLDIRLYYLYKYHMWVGPENGLQNMLGLVVSREEFEYNLSKAAESVVGGELSADEIEEIEAIERYFKIRLQKTKKLKTDIPVMGLIIKFGLDTFEINCLLLGFSILIEKKYEKIFTYLQDDISKKQPTLETVIHIFAKPCDNAADYFQYFAYNSVLFQFLIESGEGEAFFNHKLSLRRSIVEYLLRGGQTNRNSTELFDNNQGIDKMQMGFDAAKRLDSVVSPLAEIGSTNAVIVFMQGQEGSGRRFQVCHEACRQKSKCLFADLKAILGSGENFQESLYDVLCESIFEQAYLCFYHFEVLLDEDMVKEIHIMVSVLNSSIRYLCGTLFILSENEWKETGLSNGFVKVDVILPPADENERLSLWSYYAENLTIGDDISLEEFASKFRFTPGQIKSSVMQAAGLCGIHGKPIDSATLHRCCYAQVVMRLDTLASRVTPAYDWDDLILPREQINSLKDACNHVKYRHKVFHEWGYSRKIAYGTGLSMLFSGPPGTGKTMAAQVVANNLHMEMYKIQLSQIVSKYIGETEKNLRLVFNEAKNANCILFFDETDALFGKRSEVKDAHDRNANIEVAYLLQQMEEYDGVIIMATNLLQNIDAAFMRRINFVIQFPFPDAEIRVEIWNKMLDANVPVSSDVNIDFMARQFQVAGGNIKNIVLQAAFLAAADDSPVTMAHLLKSAVNEQRKSNIIIVKEDLREYADLIFKE